MPLSQHASEISAFVIPDYFLQYTVMPFGLRNAPATFQRLMNTVLSGVKNCEAYLDDMVAYSSTWSDHLNTLQEIFRCLEAASQTLNLAKILEFPLTKKFHKNQVNYSTIEKGCLALLLALQHFEVYVGLSSIPVVIAVYTDHNPLVFLSCMRNKRGS